MPITNKINVEIDPSDYYDEIFEWVADKFGPGDVFSEKVLDDWAIENGYIKEE